MHIVFGMAADGSAHPAHPGVGPGAVGGAVVGPAGMLDLLAGQLGLSGPPVPPVVRIAAWQAKLEAAAADGSRFYSASLAADALSTARLLLSWRDDLVAAGWTPTAPMAAGPRIADLAAAELAPPPLPRGRSDLLREVIASLSSGVRSDVGVVELIEDLDLLPPPWQCGRCEALSASGVVVSPTGSPDLDHRTTTISPASSRFLSKGSIGSLVGDGSLTLLESRTAIMAAEAVADWVAHDPDRRQGNCRRPSERRQRPARPSLRPPGSAGAGRLAALFAPRRPAAALACLLGGLGTLRPPEAARTPAPAKAADRPVGRPPSRRGPFPRAGRRRDRLGRTLGSAIEARLVERNDGRADTSTLARVAGVDGGGHPWPFERYAGERRRGDQRPRAPVGARDRRWRPRSTTPMCGGCGRRPVQRVRHAPTLARHRGAGRGPDRPRHRGGTARPGPRRPGGRHQVRDPSRGRLGRCGTAWCGGASPATRGRPGSPGRRPR